MATPASNSAGGALAIAELNAGLLAAAKIGRRGLVARCIAAGANVSATDDRGNTALHYAAMHGYHGVVETLIASGASDDYHAQVEKAAAAASTNKGASVASRVINSPLHWCVTVLYRDRVIISSAVTTS